MSNVGVHRFDLGIEKLFFSKVSNRSVTNSNNMFRSRNREAFLFKSRSLRRGTQRILSFDLGIEKLFFSNLSILMHTFNFCQFRSRNREAFLFKFRRCVDCGHTLSFDLGIEKLFFSNDRVLTLPPSESSFDLGIEKLFFSKAPLRRFYQTCLNS